MDNPLNPSQPEQSLHPKHHIRIYVWVALVVVALLVAANGYFYFLRLSYLKQGAETARQNEQSIEAIRAQRANSSTAYINNTFGFSIALPDSWNGYEINHIKDDIYDTTGQATANNGVVSSYQIIEIHHPLETADNPREVMPIVVFTPEQWVHIQAEEWSVGAAPIPPSILGQNSQWIMALLARYNYDFKPGWEEVDQLVHTLKVFEPTINDQGTNNNSQLDTSPPAAGWKTYTNTQYGFEFKYPGEFNIITDKVEHVFSSGKNWYRVEIKNLESVDKPYAIFEINPDGYGPFFPDKGYVLRENQDGTISIVEEFSMGGENSNDGYVLISPRNLELSNGNNFSSRFSFMEGGNDWEPTYKKIFSTFKFIK